MPNNDYPPANVLPPRPPDPFLAQAQPLEYGYDMPQGRSLREYIHILWHRKWWVILSFLFIFVSVATYCFISTPIFRTSSTLQITQDNPGSQVSVDDKLTRLTGGDTIEKFQQTQFKILQSRSLAQRVIKALNLAEHPDFKGIAEKHPELSPAAIEEAMVERFQKKLEVTPVRNSYLVEVAFQSPDKELAKNVVNAIADEYMYLSIDRRNESFNLVRTWLDRQLQEMAAKVQEAQQKLYKFGQEKDIYSLEDKDNVIIQKFVDLSSLLTKAQAEKMAKEAQYQQIQKKGPNAPLVVNNPLIVQLRQELVTQQAKVSSLQKVYLPGHPEMQAETALLRELQGRLNAEVQRLLESIRADYEAASRTERLLSDSFASQKEQVAKLQDNLTDYQILKRDAQTNEQLYQALLARVKEANIASTMVPSNVAVIDPGTLPSRPFKPKIVRNLALAGFLGLFLGVGLALVVEHLDDSIKSIDDLERYCGLPSVGVLPLLSANGKSAGLGKRILNAPLGLLLSLKKRWRRRQITAPAAVTNLDLVVYENPQAPVAEALRHTQTSIMLSKSGRPPCTLVITSAGANEGKSMVSSNLAISFALNGRETVIIDCDLRKPRVHQIFELKAQPGLTNFLSGNISLEEILRPSQIPQLTIITAGARSLSPANLLNSDTFKELLQQLRERFRHIIIDTPPILGFTDARLVAALADGVILVTKHNATHRSAGRLAHQLLSQSHAPIIGAILNGVGPYGSPYGGYYYYNYHYKYYAKYYGQPQDQ
ncbi:MAG: GumC family protein [Desulfobacca sp.]|uniref:GumC family protein n=1 Tax=Desulfobacca sp. TaxID=2067990 RepID=UPI0040490A63